MNPSGQPPEEQPKLRLAAETPEQLLKRYEKEQTTLNRRREDNLARSLAPFRVGSPHV